MGGGGGAGAPGNTPGQGSGGEGLPYAVLGYTQYYAGGGSAGSDSSTCIAGTLGGGARGSHAALGESGMPNTGGGGGGSGTYAHVRMGGGGGSGIVIIRYPEIYSHPEFLFGAVDHYISNGFRVFKFTSSGSIIF